jgi:hypothetical protein
VEENSLLLHNEGLGLVGKHVEVCDLVSKPEMNGVNGFVISYDKPSQRCSVKVHVHGKDIIAKLKVVNLKLRAEVDEKVETGGEKEVKEDPVALESAQTVEIKVKVLRAYAI